MRATDQYVIGNWISGSIFFARDILWWFFCDATFPTLSQDICGTKVKSVPLPASGCGNGTAGFSLEDLENGHFLLITVPRDLSLYIPQSGIMQFKEQIIEDIENIWRFKGWTLMKSCILIKRLFLVRLKTHLRCESRLSSDSSRQFKSWMGSKKDWRRFCGSSVTLMHHGLRFHNLQTDFCTQKTPSSASLPLK